jgi:hypothetical protein
VAKVAESYYTALARRDWKAACETRAPAERDSLARSGRPCERVFKMIIEAQVGVRRPFADAVIRDVHVTGDVARVDVVYVGRPEYGSGLAAVRENGQWFLEHGLGFAPRDSFARGRRPPQ